MLAFILFVLIVSLLYYRLFVYKTRIQKMVEKIPGPKPLPLIGTMHYKFGKYDFMDTMKKMVKDYGSIFSLWFGPLYVAVISDPKDIEIIYKHNFEVNKSFIYQKLLPWLGGGLVNATFERWRKHRKILTPTFHFKILEDFMPIFNRNGQILTSIFKNNLAKDIDLLKYMTRLSFDIICETAMGTQLNAQLTANSKFVEDSARACELNTERSFNPLYFVDWIFYNTPKGREAKKVVADVHEFVNKVIQERQKIIDSKDTDTNPEDDNNIGGRKLHTFLDLLLEYRKNGVEFSDEDIRDEVNTFMFAGHDTTSLTMSFFCHSIAQYPEIQERLFEEQKAIFGDSEPDLYVTSAHLAEMKYLEKTIKETLRLYPPSVFTMRTLKNDLQLTGGHVIPAGGNIMILAFCAHLNPEVFPEPLKFNPDRFHSVTDSKQLFSYIPFSAGPRNCIGQRYAMMEMKVVLSHLIRNFKVSSSTIPITPVFSVLLKSDTGIHVKLEQRVL